ncbi:MAG TPA: hypothetical protein VLA40_09110, partial [Rheinheimera sp.]|nr:hypothetical protein [Rheinheimera sp.]
MTTQTTTVSGDIPSVLEPYYTGTGKYPGLLEKAQQAIYGAGTGAVGYDKTFGSLAEAGLAGKGQIAGIQPGLFTDIARQRLAAMGQGLPSAFGTAEAFGNAAGTALQDLTNLQAQGVSAPELTMY